MRFAPFGDSAVEISLDHGDDRRALAQLLRTTDGVRDVIAGDESLVAILDAQSSHESIARIERVVTAPRSVAIELPEPATHIVRAIYDGPDRHIVAEACSLDLEILIARHAAATYVVEVLGFLPGFAYLGGLHRSLALPRLSTPRPRVARGSIGIAGARTAIYPFDCPGGWSLLARAIDFIAFDPHRDPPVPFALGDRVRFVVEAIAR